MRYGSRCGRGLMLGGEGREQGSREHGCSLRAAGRAWGGRVTAWQREVPADVDGGAALAQLHGRVVRWRVRAEPSRRGQAVIIRGVRSTLLVR